MPSPALTVGGTPLYPQGGLLDPSRPVYRPVYGNAGLLSQPKMDNLIGNFAGGLLNGYQVGATPDANGRYMTPIAPSGVYTTNPGDATTVTDNSTPTGSGLTYRDVIEMKFGRGGTGASGDRDFFISQLLGTNGTGNQGGGNPQWGASVDDAYDPESEYWKNVQAMLARMGNMQNGGRDAPGTPGGGGGGSPGGTNDAGQGGSDV